MEHLLSVHHQVQSQLGYHTKLSFSWKYVWMYFRWETWLICAKWKKYEKVQMWAVQTTHRNLETRITNIFLEGTTAKAMWQICKPNNWTRTGFYLSHHHTEMVKSPFTVVPYCTATLEESQLQKRQKVQNKLYRLWSAEKWNMKEDEQHLIMNECQRPSECMSLYLLFNRSHR